MARLTIKELAEIAEVSTATVSRVFSDPAKVKGDTRARVLAAAREHHFVSNGVARSLASRQSRLIGVIVPTITNSIYAAYIRAVQEQAEAQGCTVLLGVDDYDAAREARLVHRFIEQRVQGLVLTGGTRDAAVYDLLASHRVPCLHAWKLGVATDRSTVSFDNHVGARLAVDHLVGLGHRRIGLICGRTTLNDRAGGRREGFEQAMGRHGLPAAPDLMVETDFEFAQGSRAMTRLLARRPHPTAVFCANDIQAIGAIDCCREAGLSVPEDVSVVGFDDLPIARFVTPRLTTVRVPAEAMGRTVVEVLLSRIAGADDAPLRRQLPLDLVVRGSTAPPRR